MQSNSGICAARLFSTKFYIFSSKFAYNLNTQQKKRSRGTPQLRQRGIFTHRAPLYFSSPVPVRGGWCQQFWGNCAVSNTKKARWGRIFPPRCAPRRLAAPDMGVRQEFLPVCCNKQHNRKTPFAGAEEFTQGAYSPALQLATKALAASAAEV